MKIAVGAITHRREAMFAKLLESFSEMNIPSDWQVSFIFAENDTEHRVTEIVDAFRARMNLPVTLLLEPNQGIPVARNAVLDQAQEEGFDYLTFVDDDELVSKTWLTEMINGMVSGGFDLGGGPVHPIPEAPARTMSQRAALSLFQARADERNKTRAESQTDKKGRPHAIYTNNWCVNLKRAAELEQRFDIALRFTGGSDTKFCLDFQGKGAHTGWIADAHVDDVLPLRRLTLSYVYKRARDQCTNAAVLRNKRKKRVRKGIPMMAFYAFLAFLSAPFKGPVALGKAAFKLGLVAGRWNYVTGRRSAHYAPGTESLHTDQGAT